MSINRSSSEPVSETGKIEVRAEGDVQGIFATGDVTITDSEISIGQKIYNFFFGQDAKRDQRNRRVMLQMVREFWVKGVLENSLHGAVLIELGMEEHKEAVERPWDMVLQTPDQPNRVLPPGTKMVDVFDEMGQSLLILGEPGSGKTTMLLELARDTIARAEQDPTQPIPVVFNLSSWTDPKQPIADWLVEELKTKYNNPKRIAKQWIENDELLLLFDGLDEVALQRREACIKAINEFLQEHLTPLVVCSRIADYEIMASRLKLQGAVLLQPLNPQQIDDYLAGAGIEILAVRRTLQHDITLQELAQSPLMLSIMTLAYRGMSVEELQPLVSKEARRTHLFRNYVQRMFTRRGANQHYSSEQSIYWLNWLAKKMSKYGQTIFLIERLQPSWFSSRLWRWVYMFGSRLIGVLILGLVTGNRNWLSFGIAFGLCVGFIDGFWAERSDKNSTIKNSAAPGESAIYVIILWFIGGLVGGVANFFNTGLLGGLIFGLRSSRRNVANDIQSTEALSLSWGRAVNGGVSGLAFGVIIGFFVGLVAFGSVNTSDMRFAMVVGITAGLSVVLSIVVVGAMIGGVTRSIITAKTISNQGIRLSIRNAIITGLIGGGLIGLISGLLTGIISGVLQFGLIRGGVMGIIGGLIIGLFFGPIITLWYGGLDVIQHYILRLILSLTGQLPWNLTRFLDYATDLIFLRKVGGGYIFIHRLLMEHFASLEPE